MEYKQFCRHVSCSSCHSESVQLIDVIADFSEREGTIPIWKCTHCHTIFDGRSQELKNIYISNMAYMASDQGYDILNLLSQEILKGSGTASNFKNLLLNDNKIREIVDCQISELKQKIDELCKDSLTSLKLKIKNFELGE